MACHGRFIDGKGLISRLLSRARPAKLALFATKMPQTFLTEREGPVCGERPSNNDPTPIVLTLSLQASKVGFGGQSTCRLEPRQRNDAQRSLTCESLVPQRLNSRLPRLPRIDR